MDDQTPAEDDETPNRDLQPDHLQMQNQREIQERIASQELRKLKAKNEKHHTIWFGLGMFGLIGWSVAIPAVLGATIGMWIDSRWPTPYSWSLMLLIGGIALGCFNAWKWLHKEGGID